MSNQFLEYYFLFMVASWLQCIFLTYTIMLVVPLSMCSNIFCFADLHIYSHKKALSGQQQLQSKSSWPLSDLPWHTKHREFLVMGYAVLSLTCEPPFVYCMCFTAMEPCYSYRESKTIYYWTNWWPIFSVSWVSLDYKITKPELILCKVFSCLEATCFLSSSDLILAILA